MGVFKALHGAVEGVQENQWREMYYCDSLPRGVLAQKGSKRVGPNSSNTKGDSDVISDGSIIVVNEGQTAVVVENGKVIDVYQEAGEHVFHSNRSRNIFSKGGLTGYLDSVTEAFAFGGDMPVHQEVIYFNMKEQTSASCTVTCPFHFTDKNTGFSMDATARLHCVYSFRLIDPLTFYRTAYYGDGSASGSYSVMGALGRQMEAEIATVAGQALSRLCAKGVRPSELPGMTEEIGKIMGEIMGEKWRSQRGMSPYSIAVDSLVMVSEDSRTVQRSQYNASLRDPTLAAATLVGAQGAAAEAAARNSAAVPLNLFGAPAGSQPTLWYCPNCRKFVSTKFCDNCGAGQSSDGV